MPSFDIFVLIFDFFLYRLFLGCKDSIEHIDATIRWTFTIMWQYFIHFGWHLVYNSYTFEIRFTVCNFVIIWNTEMKIEKIKSINILFGYIRAWYGTHILSSGCIFLDVCTLLYYMYFIILLLFSNADLQLKRFKARFYTRFSWYCFLNIFDCEILICANIFEYL